MDESGVNDGHLAEVRESGHAAELTEYYPDLIQDGGLPGALQRVARERGLDLGNVSSDSERWLAAPATVVADSSRGRIWINIGLSGRSFSIALGSGLGFPWAEGKTASLEEVAAVIGAWRGGILLAPLRERFPFLGIERRAEEYERGRPPAETSWDIILADEEYSSEREMTTLLHSRPRIRSLYPDFDVLTLRLFLDFHDKAAGAIRVEPEEGGLWTVWFTKDGEEVYIQPSEGYGYYTFRPRAGTGRSGVRLQDLPDAVESFL
jgi:hypothetical protein